MQKYDSIPCSMLSFTVQYTHIKDSELMIFIQDCF
jgi:hypothetical protein